MIVVGQKGKVTTIALVVAMLTNSACEANGPTSQLVKEWVQVERTTIIAGVYNNRCSECSERGIEFTGLISLLIPEKELASIKHAIDQVKIIQSDREISIVATDSKGKVAINKSYKEGTDYSSRENELTITETWDGGDEWGSSKGKTLTSLIKNNGHLLVRSTVSVRERTTEAGS